MTLLNRGALAATLMLAASACAMDDMGASAGAGMSSSSMAMPSTTPETRMTAGASSEATVMVGGAAMYPSKNIIENAVNSADHTTLVAAVTAAGLVDTLSGPGPFTVFAPTNAAFAKLPPGAVEGLLKPEMKPMLQKALTYHVVAGRMTAADIVKAIQAGGGKASLTTVAGGALTASLNGSTLVLTDASGGKSNVTIGDVMQSNGVIHVVDTVLLGG